LPLTCFKAVKPGTRKLRSFILNPLLHKTCKYYAVRHFIIYVKFNQILKIKPTTIGGAGFLNDDLFFTVKLPPTFTIAG